MRGAFDDESLEQRKSSVDTEFTLGAGTILLLSAGFVVVCGLCFGLGYIVGHRGAASQTAAQRTDDVPANAQASSSQQKPSARAQAAVPALAQSTLQTDGSPQPVATDLPQSSAAAVPMAAAQNSAPATGQPQVRPALPAVTSAPQPSITYTSRPAISQAQPQVRPASIPSATALWVQIAAVSHVEDAQVLTTALRKHGYTVTPRREADDLIHVRIGPFNTSDEANRWRAKLLDEGYNAEIQQ